MTRRSPEPVFRDGRRHTCARGVQALAEIARAVDAFDWDLDRPEASQTARELRSIVARDQTLFDWAVLTVTNLLHGDEPDDVIQALLARSGYQARREVSDSRDSLLDPGHLADVDAELVEVIEDPGLAALVVKRRPAAIPRGHRWWFEPAT